jgi:beta-glucanase (GH16 family)
MFRVRAIAAVCTTAIWLSVVAVSGMGPASAAPVRPASAAIAPSPTCGYVRPAKPGGGRYTCTFTDDFNGSALNPARWMAQTTAANGYATGRECYVDNPRNLSVSGGRLHLTSRVEASPFTCHSPYGDWTTNQTAGSVVSWGKFSQTYGRFEFRAKFPKTSIAGVDSALWMYPQNPSYGAWPRSGEIDIAERFGSTFGDNVYPSLHYIGKDASLFTGYNCVVRNSTTQFHSYAVEWTPTTMYFYYDSRLCFQHSWSPAAPLVAPQPFDKAFGLVMTQTGGVNAPVGTTTTMDIDWVRAWK